VRDKYESELKELEESERNMQEKYNNMKVRARPGIAVFDSSHIIFPRGCIAVFKIPLQPSCDLFCNFLFSEIN